MRNHESNHPGDPELAAESAERAAALRRGQERVRERSEGREPPRHRLLKPVPPGLVHHAFTALADNVRDYAIFLVDAEGVIIFWGEGARLIKWWTQDEAEGSHLRLLYPDGGAEDGTAEEHIAAAAEAGEYTGEGHRVRSDGSTFWGGVTLTALRDAEGELLGFAKVTRDLTAQRATAAARKAAFEAAEEASRLKSLFLATMSHEIRTPLNAVMAYTDILGMELGGPLSPVQHDQLKKIRTSSQHLLGIVDEVLDLSRIESGRIAVGRERVRLGTVVSQALMLVEPQAGSRGVEVVDAVSGMAADHWCWGDEERVRQILLNLLSNAAKFTPGEGQIKVSGGTATSPPPGTELRGAGPWAYVRVEDTGQGIPSERLEAIFEPFVQGDMSLTRQHGGTGLGLAISRSLARLMQGDLTVRSEVGAGSTFFLWLPAAPEQDAAPAEDTDGSWPPSTGTLREIRGVVLAELEPILQAYTARLRTDPEAPSARRLSDVELQDHLLGFLSDIAQTLAGVDLASGADSELLRDGTSIQRTIAQRHGAQRARLGWGEDEIRREFQILREELADAVSRRVRRPRQREVAEATGVVHEFLNRAEQISIESHRYEMRE